MLPHLSVTTRIYLLCSFMSLGGLLFGYELGILTGVYSMDSFQTQVDVQNKSTALTSSLMAGAFVGALASGPLANFIGRRGIVCFGLVLFLLGGILQTGADEIGKIYAGRAVSGLCVGMLSMAVPLYHSEIAPKHLRGRLISIQQFAITLGICVAAWVDYGFSEVASSASWRIPFGLPLTVALVYLIGSLLIPRSPRFLIDKHMDGEALHVLSLVRGDGTSDHPQVLMEYIEIKQSILFEEKFKPKHYWTLFRKGPDNNRKRLLLGMGVQIFQQLTMINALLLYAPALYQAAGIRGRQSVLLANGINSIVNLVFTIPPIIFIDRWGRRPIMIIGSIICCISVIIMTIISAITGLADTISIIHNVEKSQSAAAQGAATGADSKDAIVFLVMMYVFIASFACTWGPIGWIYPTELYSQDVRAQALGITTAANWLFNFGVTQLTPIMFNNIQWKAFVVYDCFLFVMPFIVYRYFPETMGKSLEEVDLIFTCNFNYYDVNVHHPQTAAAALVQMGRRRRQTDLPFTNASARIQEMTSNPPLPLHV
ncbi:hypothetical protein VTP01DRAFT_1749, partial [Rhizomucor pusillus]|uniref:uncharacterized protein n=1 Tax=Rhizomucor pusillus TaxID=4840 RepID=UPI003742D111